LRCSFLLLPLVVLTLSCGGGNSRQLHSISISQTVVGSEIHFIAAGTFSSAPTTISPLPVDWTTGLMAPPPPQYTYRLTSAPYVFDCSNANPGPLLPVVAFAPTDPSAPMSGTVRNVVTATASVTCQ
jgi:hypothetical protein